MTETEVEVPPSEKVAINSMAEKFKSVMVSMPDAKIAPAAPPEKPKPAEKPAEPAVPSEAKPAEKPAAETPKPVEAKPEPKTRQQWKELEELKDKFRAEAEALKPVAAERDQLKAELDAARKGSEEYEAAKKQLAEYDQIVKQFYLENDPTFKAHYAERISTAVLEAKEAVGPEHAPKIEQILQIPPSTYRDQQMAELYEGLNEFAKGELVRAYTDLKRTERERKAQLDKSPENVKKLNEHNAKKAKEAADKAAESRMNLLQIINTKMDSELTDAPVELTSDIKARTKAVVEGTASSDVYVGMLVDAAKGRKYALTVQEQADKIAKLEAQISELQSSQPSLSGGPAAPAKAGEPEDIGAKFRRLINQQK